MLESITAEAGVFLAGVVIGAIGLTDASYMHGIIESCQKSLPVDISDLNTEGEKLLFKICMFLLYFVILILLRSMFNYFRLKTGNG